MQTENFQIICINTLSPRTDFKISSQPSLSLSESTKKCYLSGNKLQGHVWLPLPREPIEYQHLRLRWGSWSLGAFCKQLATLLETQAPSNETRCISSILFVMESKPRQAGTSWSIAPGVYNKIIRHQRKEQFEGHIPRLAKDQSWFPLGHAKSNQLVLLYFFTYNPFP